MARPCSYKSASNNQSHIPFKGASRYYQPRKQIVNCSLTNGRSFEPSEPQHVPLLHGYKCAKMTCIPTEPSLTRRKKNIKGLACLLHIRGYFRCIQTFHPTLFLLSPSEQPDGLSILDCDLGVRRRTSQLSTPHVIHRGMRPPDIPIVSAKSYFGLRSTR